MKTTYISDWHPGKPGQPNKVQIAGGEKLTLMGDTFKNHQITVKAPTFFICRRTNNWQKLLKGGALYDEEGCGCILCAKVGIAF